MYMYSICISFSIYMNMDSQICICACICIALSIIYITVELFFIRAKILFTLLSMHERFNLSAFCYFMLAFRHYRAYE